MIYALLDKGTLIKKGISLKHIANKIELLSIPIAQYRNKFASLSEQKKDLIIIRQYFSGKLIINDTIELISFADGLHIGQEDIREFSSDLNQAMKTIRSRVGNKFLGLSTHNYKEIIEANSLDLNYIGLGAYRATSTKEDVKILGEKALKLAKYSKHAVALIGGVRLNDKFGNEIKYSVVGSDLYKS
jgi:thiamine-phosphate pyrophosphorylase